MSDKIRPTQIYTDEVLVRQVVALALLNKTRVEMAKELNVHHATIGKIVNSDKFKELIAEVGDEALTQAKTYVRVQMGRLVTDAVNVIKKNLKEGNLEAAKVVFKTVGLDNEENRVGETNLTVVLPGADEKPTIEVDSGQASSE
jgi:hypothetical protein